MWSAKVFVVSSWCCCLVLCHLFAAIDAQQHHPAARRGSREQPLRPGAPGSEQLEPHQNSQAHLRNVTAGDNPNRGYTDEGPSWGAWGPRQLEYRMTRLEAQVAERAQDVRAELRENSRRVQALEWQSGEMKSALETLRSEVTRLILIQQHQSQTGSQHGQRHQQERDQQDMEKRGIVNLILNSLKGLAAEMAAMRNNVSQITDATAQILENTQQHMVNKQFFNNGLMDLKHHQTQRSPAACLVPGASDPQQNAIPRDCTDLSQELNGVFAKTGIYRVKPDPSQPPFLVYCDMDTDKGGWTVIQSRSNGDQDFYQNWHEYKHGFGNLGGEFWLGLEKIHQLTADGMAELMVILEDENMDRQTAHYGAFAVGPEVEGYPLKVLAQYDGTAGDSLTYHAGSRFSTKDLDQDGWPEGSCAQSHQGGWWYKSCDQANLNGKYIAGNLPQQFQFQGVYWNTFRGSNYSLFRSAMMVRVKH